MKTLTLTVIARERTANNKKFLTFTTQVRDEWVQLKFRADAENAPRKAGKYTIKLNLEDVNVAKDGDYNVIWVKTVLSKKMWTDEELKAEKMNKNIDYFGDLVEDETND